MTSPCPRRALPRDPSSHPVHTDPATEKLCVARGSRASLFQAERERERLRGGLGLGSRVDSRHEVPDCCAHFLRSLVVRTVSRLEGDQRHLLRVRMHLRVQIEPGLGDAASEGIVEALRHQQRPDVIGEKFVLGAGRRQLRARRNHRKPSRVVGVAKNVVLQLLVRVLRLLDVEPRQDLGHLGLEEFDDAFAEEGKQRLGRRRLLRQPCRQHLLLEGDPPPLQHLLLIDIHRHHAPRGVAEDQPRTEDVAQVRGG
mmetsp:Transcript_22987/g.54954  ORF Transcript_22987/g.54954 Transcript_22987/m.54954 type:complete len:255 (-) Transcript_22987:37-801(-)